MELAARLAVEAEVAALGGSAGDGGGNGAASAAATAPASSSSYPEIEYSEQPRREGEQTATPSGNPFAPTNTVPPSMPPANALSGPRKRAVLVGCNYASTPSASLQGCINDASCLRYLLLSRFGFQDDDIVLLLDTSPCEKRMGKKREREGERKAMTFSTSSTRREKLTPPPLPPPPEKNQPPLSF